MDDADFQDFVLSENVRRFRSLLEAQPDPGLEPRLRELLAASERELAMHQAQSQGVRPPRGRPPADGAREALIAEFNAAYADEPRLAALIDPGPGLVIVAVNRMYELSSGLSREAVCGKPLFQTFPDNPNHAAADGVANLYSSLRRVAETGQPHEMGLQRYDVPDSEGVWRERYWRPVNTPVRDDNDRIVFILHLVDEVSPPGT